MPRRFRSNERVFHSGGTLTRFWPDSQDIMSQYVEQQNVRVEDNCCIDTVPLGRDEFYVHHFGSFNPLNGSTTLDDGSRVVFENYFANPWDSWEPRTQFNWPGGPTVVLPPHLLPSEPDKFGTRLTRNEASLYATAVAARSNPSRPTVSLPVFLGEMKDVPQAIYERGKQGIRKLSRKSDSVGVHYGILPFVSDAMKLMNISESVERRIKELNSLDSKGGLRRRIKIFSETRSKTIKSIVHRSQAPLKGETVDKTVNNIWGVIRWIPEDDTLPKAGGIEQQKLARALVLGTSARNGTWDNLSDIWELLPWSWAADWFGNMGDYLMASRNAIPVKIHDLHIMQRVTTTRTLQIRGYESSNGEDEAFYTLNDELYRFAAKPVLSADVRFLSARQMSILAGIVLGRTPKGGRP